jgi:anhydro-N-acetylmuramic acid kinase
MMSGTSLDGVDAALIRTDGETVVHCGQALTRPYPDQLRDGLRSVLGGVGKIEEIEREMTLFHVQVAQALLFQAKVLPAAVDVVGFHGHTILHRPQEQKTWQIGDGALLADQLGIPVVNDFRSIDVRAGGQGAPLVPIFHAALASAFPLPVAVLNLGGVGNVTWIGPNGQLSAFDTGPGNALIDDWALRHTGRPVDLDGALAAAGRADRARVAAFMAHPYFDRFPPKSLDRDEFQHLAQSLTAGLSVVDGAATLTALTVAAVARARQQFPSPPQRWLVCGGGRHNPEIMAGLRATLSVPVESVESEGWDGDALEAQAFAYLAVRSLRSLPLTFPTTTGVPAALGGGYCHCPMPSSS